MMGCGVIRDVSFLLHIIGPILDVYNYFAMTRYIRPSFKFFRHIYKQTSEEDSVSNTGGSESLN